MELKFKLHILLMRSSGFLVNNRIMLFSMKYRNIQRCLKFYAKAVTYYADVPASQSVAVGTDIEKVWSFSKFVAHTLWFLQISNTIS